MQATATQNAPSSSLVVPHFFWGGTIWLLALILLAIYPDTLTQHYFNFKLLAITHLIVLSWITTIILGALYQLLPVILMTKLYSEKTAYSSFVLLQIGSAGLAICFWNGIFSSLLILFGSVICLAIILFTFNLFYTAKTSSVKRIEKRFIITSAMWLIFTVLFGLTLAINLSFPFLQTSHLDLLKLHAHAGIIGWFLMLIMGVGSVLIPMFMLSHNLNKKNLNITYYLLNGALITGIISHFFTYKIGVYLAFGMGIIGIVFFLLFILEAFKKRVKRKLDIGMKKTMLSFILLTFPLIFGVLTFLQKDAVTTFSTAYFSTLIIGFISTLIMAQTYKTLPFIIWLKKYKSVVGKEKIPLPRDLYDENVAIWQYWIHLIGFLILTSGILFNWVLLAQVGLWTLVIAAFLYYKNLLKIITHKKITHEYK